MKEEVREFINTYIKENKEVDPSKFSAELHSRFPGMSMFDMCIARNYLKESLDGKKTDIHE